jgi:UDP-2-acetamido-3-amino-2,3-dideoxy-glucuronate N-acetyltransferase
VFDVSSVRRAEIDRTFRNLRTYETYEEMLADELDAIIIASPADLHAEMAMQALLRGKHVFVEKPLALHTADARALVETAEGLGLTLFVGHLLLHHPAVNEMLRQIRAGAIGDIRHVRTRRLSLGRVRTAEDVWWSFAPHDVAVMLEIFGELPTGAMAGFSSHVSPGIADFVNADFTFSGGRSAHIEVTWLDPSRSQRLDVFGSKGIITLTDDRLKGASLTLTDCGAFVNGEVADTWKRDTVALEFSDGEPLRLELENFITAVTTGKPAMTDGREGLRVVEVLAMVAPGRARGTATESVA